MDCENCRYDEDYDPETHDVEMSWQNNVCDKCGNTTYCCCTCEQDEADRIEAIVEERVEELRKEFQEKIDKIYEILSDTALWDMRKNDG